MMRLFPKGGNPVVEWEDVVEIGAPLHNGD